MTVRRWWIALVCLIGVAACAPRPGPEVLTLVAPVAEGEVVRVFVVSSRTPEGNGFSDGLSYETGYRFYDISVPDGREAGTISWPDGPPDAVTDFAVVGTGHMSRSEFLKEVGTRSDDGTGVFVHGFNVRFEESLFRMAQLAVDADESGAMVLFAWPSEGKPLGYEADRQAVLFSRDPMAELLRDLTAVTRGDVTVFAHSMGGWLTVEALRMLQQEKRRDVLDQLEVILAAPDIDGYVFGRALEVIGPMRHPMVLLVSKDDRALALSSRLAGGRPRVGLMDINDPLLLPLVQRANLQVIDITDIAADPMGHSRYVQMAGLFAEMQSSDGGQEDFSSAGVFIFNVFEQTLVRPVTSIVSR